VFWGLQRVTAATTLNRENPCQITGNADSVRVPPAGFEPATHGLGNRCCHVADLYLCSSYVSDLRLWRFRALTRYGDLRISCGLFADQDQSIPLWHRHEPKPDEDDGEWGPMPRVVGCDANAKRGAQTAASSRAQPLAHQWLLASSR
jgi:hypothetical protein